MLWLFALDGLAYPLLVWWRRSTEGRISALALVCALPAQEPAGIVSGSGPTVALLCADAESAGGVAVELAGSGTCRAVRVATGPAQGARVVGTR